MGIDLLILALLAVFAIRGFFSGVVAQLNHWAGLAFGHAVAKPLALILTLMLAPRLGIPPVGVRVGLSVLCFCTFYVVGTLIARPFLKRLAKGREKNPMDRAGSCLLALGKGGILLFVVLSGLLFFEGSLGRQSIILGFVRRHNLYGAAPLPALARLKQLMEADPALRASLQDERLAKALKSGDWAALQRDPRIAALLEDPRIVGSLSDPLDYEEK